MREMHFYVCLRVDINRSAQPDKGGCYSENHWAPLWSGIATVECIPLDIKVRGHQRSCSCCGNSQCKHGLAAQELSNAGAEHFTSIRLPTVQRYWSLIFLKQSTWKFLQIFVGCVFFKQALFSFCLTTACVIMGFKVMVHSKMKILSSFAHPVWVSFFLWSTKNYILTNGGNQQLFAYILQNIFFCVQQISR